MSEPKKDDMYVHEDFAKAMLPSKAAMRLAKFCGLPENERLFVAMRLDDAGLREAVEALDSIALVPKIRTYHEAMTQLGRCRGALMLARKYLISGPEPIQVGDSDD